MIPPPELESAVLLLKDIIKLLNVSVIIFIPSVLFISIYLTWNITKIEITVIYIPIILLDNKFGASFLKIRQIPTTPKRINNAKYSVPTKNIAKLLTIFPTIPVPSIPIMLNSIIITPTISLLYSNLFLFFSVISDYFIY